MNENFSVGNSDQFPVIVRRRKRSEFKIPVALPETRVTHEQQVWKEKFKSIHPHELEIVRKLIFKTKKNILADPQKIQKLWPNRVWETKINRDSKFHETGKLLP